MKNVELQHFATNVELAKAAATHWLSAVGDSASNKKSHLVALSGGRIAKVLFDQIVEQLKTQPAPLNHVHFFWADERAVAPDSPDSSFKVANESLFRPLRIAASQVHRLKGELSPEISLMDANVEIFRMAPTNAQGQAVLDYIFLGMGEDGHVASLFPNAPGIAARNEPYLYVQNSPKPPSTRLSMSYSTIAAARQVVVLASGEGKSDALRKSLEQTGATPLAKVLQMRASTKIYTDFSL